jgi:hypothetical protein
MAPSNESRIRGLKTPLAEPDEAREAAVAGLLEAAKRRAATAHLENVVYELRDAAAAGPAWPWC